MRHIDLADGYWFITYLGILFQNGHWSTIHKLKIGYGFKSSKNV